MTGGRDDRTGRRMVRMLAPRKLLKVRVARPRVRAGGRQRLLVRGLAPKEPLAAVAGGKRLTPKRARADAKSVYRLRFKPTRRVGRHRVQARGLAATRKGRATFRVVPR